MPTTCDVVSVYGSSTALVQGFEGIPQNLIINIVVWVLLLVLFLILRRTAWNYGRLTRVTRTRSLEEETSHNAFWTTLFYGDTQNSDKTKIVDLDQQAPPEGWRRFVPMFFFVSNENQRQHCGRDAVLYQTFQIYAILFTAGMCLLCLAIILPLNLKGDVRNPDKENFATTTISNLSKTSTFLWAHLVTVVLAFVCGFVLMMHFSKKLRIDNVHASSTIMIVGIPRKRCQANKIVQHFHEAYPNFQPLREDAVSVVYDFRDLNKTQKSKDMAVLALAYSERMQEETGIRPSMVPCLCSMTCCRSGCCIRCGTSCGCACAREVDAIEFYTQEVEKYRNRFDNEKVETLRNPVGIAFVTFANVRESTLVLEDHQSTLLRPARPPTTSMSSVLRTADWDVSYAPHVEDILWVNLCEDTAHWWIKAIFINIGVFIIFFFLTTPAYVLNLLNGFNMRMKEIFKNTLLVRFLPSLILWLVSVLLPFLVYLSDQLIGHWTKTVEAKVTMVKTFICLIFMVLILPSLGLTSIPALLQWLFPALFPVIPPTIGPAPHTTNMSTTISPTTIPWSNETTTIFNGPTDQWECIFLPDSGAFFVNYIITAAIIGTIVELLRFPELIIYALRMMSARSHAEQRAVTQTTVFYFDYGTSYAWVLLVFSVTMSYSVVCPLIMPMGLLYQVLKFLVDRYNLYYAYSRTRIDKNIHGIAVTCALVSLLFMQINLLSFFFLRMSMEHPLVICALCAFLFSILAVLLHVMLVWCRDTQEIRLEEMGGENEMFVPDQATSTLTLESSTEDTGRRVLSRPVSQDVSSGPVNATSSGRRPSKVYQPGFIAADADVGRQEQQGSRASSPTEGASGTGTMNQEGDTLVIGKKKPQ